MNYDDDDDDEDVDYRYRWYRHACLSTYQGPKIWKQHKSK